MDLAKLERRLGITEAAIVQGEMRIARQRDLVARLRDRAWSRETRLAVDLLSHLTAMQVALVTTRNKFARMLTNQS